MEHLFIINPAAGSHDRTGEYSKIIHQLCREKGLTYEIRVSTAPGEATRIAREAAQSGEEVRLYACGGDGTLHEVINGAVGKAEGPEGYVSYINNFQDGKAHVEAKVESEEGTLEVCVELSRLSLPSVVSIPFEDPAVRHRPLYSQKDLFKVQIRIYFALAGNLW